MPLTDILSRTPPPEDARATMEFEKMRFELSWRYFDLHARQRTQLFHFFVILSPFVFGGCFYLLKERTYLGYSPSIIAPCAGGLLVLVFLGLDRRNRQMIDVAERALMLLEQQFLFADYRRLDVEGATFPGLFTIEHNENDKTALGKLRGHTALISAVYLLSLAAFAALAAYAYLIFTGTVKL
ncbi:hypothetical protein [Bradyrhizobium sp. 17]|uniref:RipA family octameric membrane protein n=1 Tax=Bradyrhizobium sp. 17 TaxID=2782649 RepID=UPI001FFBF1F8|nr:hypothetical protein [Bradyrhizobium sp. 17]